MDSCVNLSPNPEQVIQMLQKELPFTLPIADKRETRNVVRILRIMFKFEQLSDSFFKYKLVPLPRDLVDLDLKFTDSFLIKERANLKFLPEYYQALHQQYTFDKLPEAYFEVPEPKPDLPLTPQALCKELQGIFLFTPKDAANFKNYVEILREKYSFRRMPNDFLKRKRRLPSSPEALKISTQYTFPITEKEIALQFISQIKKEYNVTEPMTREYIQINFTDKPNLPVDYTAIKEVKLDIPITWPRTM
ncbi:3024_t:CDS:1, partial [Gigaspora margarita]